MLTRAIPNLNPALLMNYRAARRLFSRNTRLAVLGDSTAAGVVSLGNTSQVQQSMPYRLADCLNARGIRAAAHNRFGCASGTFVALVGMDSRIAYTGGWTQGTHLGQGGNSWAPTAAASLTFTPWGKVTNFDIYWRDGATGRNFNWQVDGGATTAINSSGTTQLQKTSITGLSQASHAITLNWVAGTPTIIGIDAYDRTLVTSPDGVAAPSWSRARSEISVYNWGISGATSAQLADDTDTVTGRMAELKSGKTMLTPDLLLIRPGVNDWRNSVSVASMVTSITSVITAAQANACDVILLTPRFDNGTAGTSAQQEDYANAIRALGPAMNCPVLDLRAYYGSYAIANAAGFYSDTVHGDTNGLGYWEEADFVAAALASI